jgi:hypothetical protein
VLSAGMMKVSDSVTLRHVTLVKSLGFNLLSVSSFLVSISRSISKQVPLVCWTLEMILYALSSPRVRFSEPIFPDRAVLLVSLLHAFQLIW